MISLQSAATIMAALADSDVDQLSHLASVLDAVGEAFLSVAIDGTPDDWPGADAALIEGQQWAHDAASRLDALIRRAVEA